MATAIESADLKTVGESAPTSFDHPMGAFSAFEGKRDWLIAPCTLNRDSGLTARVNWESQTKALENAQANEGSADSEDSDYEIHRIGHWGCGWYEVAIVRPGSACHREAAEIACALEGYPILDDSAHSEAVWEASHAAWADLSVRDRYELLKRSGDIDHVSVFACRRAEIPQGADRVWEIIGGWL